MGKTLEIGGVHIGHGHPCRTVAEISNNHNGSLETCKRLIRAARDAGADFVKFQAYTPDELVLLRGNGPPPPAWADKYETIRDLYTDAQTPLAWFTELREHCKEVGIPWFTSAFGLGSVTLTHALGCPVFKMASLDYGKRKLRDLVRSTGKPIIQSCPKGRAPKTDAFLLYCPPGYPQEDIVLRNIQHGYDGFSYHGTDPLIPALAVTQGAQLVECHFQLDDEPSKLEAGVSLTATQFAEMVSMIRRAEEAL